MTVYLPNIDDTAHAIGADKKPAAALDDWFGEVKSTSPFRVAPLGSTVGLECTPIGSANVGDIVYVTTRKNGHFVAHCGASGGGGTTDYNSLTNKPTITEPVYGSNPTQYSTVTIQGDKTFDELGMHPFTNQEIENLLTIADAS